MNEINKKVLKPCPFCGCKAELNTVRDFDGNIMSANVYCIVCGGRGGYFRNPDTAIDVWNRRVNKN